MKHVLLVWILLSTTIIVFAQSDDDFGEPWTIVESCITQQSIPPADWSFDGTLVMTSPNKLHAYRQEWETPQITGFLSFFVLSEALSPDSRYYAVVEGTSERDYATTSFNSSAVRIYDTLNGTEYVIPWDINYAYQRRVYGHRLYWLNPTELVYSGNSGWLLIDPFTGDIGAWEQHFLPLHFAFELSPDGQSSISHPHNTNYWTVHTQDEDLEVPIDAEFSALWHTSSEFYVTTTPYYSGEEQNLLMFNLDGEIEHLIYRTMPDDFRIQDARWMVWSPDGRYLAFADNHLYIADLETQQVIDTCLTPEQFTSQVWSPTENQLAIIGLQGDEREIRIIDFDNSVSYIVGYHGGELIGWRTDD